MIIKIDNHIILDQLEQKHAQELFELVSENKNHLREWLPWVDNMNSVEFIQNFINGSNQRNKDGNEHAFVIIHDHKIVGRNGVYKIDNQNKIGEIGYWITEDLQGRGIIAASCKALIDYCFQHLQLNRVEIKCAAENDKSQKIPERLGFQFEGIIRQGERMHDRFVDLKLYSLLKNDSA